MLGTVMSAGLISNTVAPVQEAHAIVYLDLTGSRDVWRSRDAGVEVKGKGIEENGQGFPRSKNPGLRGKYLLALHRKGRLAEPAESVSVKNDTYCARGAEHKVEQRRELCSSLNRQSVALRKAHNLFII
jgi:hypothetical protein